jgi:HAE1 family hydrophobic/amphiphilic exporter-1
MNITDLSIKRPLAVSMIFLGIIIFGAISVVNLPVDLFPNITFPMMIVLTTYPGAGPEEIETMVTDPLEKSIGTVNNLDKITSRTQENVSNIFLQFAWGTNIDAAANDVRDAIGFITPYLPDEVDAPLIFKFDVSQQPVVMYTIAGDIDPLELEKVGNDIADRIQRVDGVAASYATGGTFREIQIILDPVKLYNTGITVDQISGALQAQNVNYPLGNIETDKKVFILRTMGQFKDLDEIRKTVIGNANGVPILLSQVAEVKSQGSEQTSISRTNGRPAIWGFVQKRTDANSAKVGNAVVKKLNEIQRELPPGIKLDIFFNQADYIMRSVKSTANTLIIGAILAIMVLFLFLGNLRSTIYMAVGIPISVFFTLFLMYMFKMSLNIISLGGLTIAIGMVLDAAIVVFESIYRKKEAGMDPMRAASLGTKEVGSAIIASTLTTIAVFLPLLLVSGLASIFFRQLALTVTFALISSLLVALTIIPMLSARFGRVKSENTGLGKVVNNFYTGLENLYVRIIKYSLAHRRLIVLSTIGIFVVSLVLIGFIGTELIPETDRGEITISAEMPVGTNLAVTDSVIQKLENIIIKEVPEIDVLSTSIGSGSGFNAIFLGTPGPHSAQINLELVDREERSRSIKQIQRDLRPKITNVPGLNVKFTTENMASTMFGGGKPIELKVFGFDRLKAESVGDMLMEKMKKVKGLVDIESSLGEGKPELRLMIDRQKAANFGTTSYQVGSLLRSRIEGVVAGQFHEQGEEYDIKLIFDKNNRNSIEKVRSMTIPTPLGEVPIRNFITDTIAEGPVTIEHDNNTRLITITAGVEGRDPGSAGREVQKIIEESNIPADFNVEMSGGYKEQMNTFRDLGLIILLSLVLVYMIMAGQFESLKEPFLIMFTIPLALIGVLWMLFFSGTTINMQSLLGVLLLGGIVVNNAIVYVTYTNQLRREQGMQLVDAVVEAGRVRLRPILMTAFTTIFGLIPMALAMGTGNELRAPMARSVIGGLLLSTFLTLVFIPVLYTLLEKKKKPAPEVAVEDQTRKQ